MIKIRQPLFFTEIGQKDNQEDSLYPLNPSPESKIFVLCDGMGGHDNGEVASATVSNTLGEFLSRRMEEAGQVDINTFKEGLAEAYKALDEIDTHSAKTPGTTMVTLCLNEASYLVAHIGDSRLYHIRPSLYNPQAGKGGIIYMSSDHSLVNELLKSGELTREQARTFPHKNVITRAMQPNLETPYKADAYIFSDIQAGDYFFMCCDGVLERLTNRELCRIIADPQLDDVGKLQAIKAICDGKTKDNYTCWLIPVDEVITKSAADENKEQKPVVIGDEPSTGVIGAMSSGKETTMSGDVEPVPLPEPHRDSSYMHTLRWLTDAAVLLMLLFSIFILCIGYDRFKEMRDNLFNKEEAAQEQPATPQPDSTLPNLEKEAQEAEAQAAAQADSTGNKNETPEPLYNPTAPAASKPVRTMSNPPRGVTPASPSPATTPEVTPSEVAGNEGAETAAPTPAPEAKPDAKQDASEKAGSSVKENIQEMKDPNTGK